MTPKKENSTKTKERVKGIKGFTKEKKKSYEKARADFIKEKEQRLVFHNIRNFLSIFFYHNLTCCEL